LKRIFQLALFLLFSMLLCSCAQAASPDCSVDVFGIGLGTVYKNYQVPSTSTITITNDSPSETLYLKQPVCDIASVGPLIKTQLEPGESATCTVSARFDLPNGFHKGNVRFYSLDGEELATVDVDYYVQDEPEVLIETISGDGYTVYPSSVWQGTGNYHFVVQGVDLGIIVGIHPHYKPRDDGSFAIKVNGEKVDNPILNEDKTLSISFPNIQPGKYTITVEGVESRPLLTPDEDRTDSDQNALDGKLDNPDDELFGKLLKYAEEFEIDRGAKYVVWLEVEHADETTSAMDKRLIHSVVDEESITHYLDINLLKQIGTGNINQITNVDGNVSITLEIPKGHRDAPELMYRNFGIVRLHDEVAEKLYGQYSPETGLLTFTTNRFSTYALFYEDIPINEDIPISEDEMPHTGDNSLLVFWFMLLVFASLILMRVRKRTI